MSFPNSGVFWVALVGLVLVLAVLAVVDAVFAVRYRQLIGYWVQAWARRFPVLAFLLAVVLGLLIGHFYWSTPAVCPIAANGQVLQAGTDLDCVPPNPSPPANT